MFRHDTDRYAFLLCNRDNGWERELWEDNFERKINDETTEPLNVTCVKCNCLK